jgi:hypothetical protein
MSRYFHAFLALGVDLGEKKAFFTEGLEDGVYGWAEQSPQKEIMTPILYNETAIFLAVKGCVVDAAGTKSPVPIDLAQLIATADQQKVEAFKAHLLKSGFDDIELRWRLIAQVS